MSDNNKACAAEAFKIESPFSPAGDQPQAIQSLVESLRLGTRDQVLLGVTGSGKTFTMAHVIAELNRPTLVMAPNKTLAAQLYSEFKEFFPHNAVEYFVSYYDYYQPEAYIPSSDTFIEKDSAINDEIDKLRHSATRSLLERRDVLIVASVSCIYGLGAPEEYQKMMLQIDRGAKISRDELLRKLIAIHYDRDDLDFKRGSFRVRGDIVDIFPAYESRQAVRIEFFGAEVAEIYELDSFRGSRLNALNKLCLYPASHYVSSEDIKKKAQGAILDELRERLQELKSLGKHVEAQRLEQRTLFDVEMIQEVGYCSGVENYSRHLTGREPGAAPPTLLEFMPEDFLLVLDESHVTVPQIGAMYRGDRSRKMNLVEHGFRLPCALDNRPLKFEEFEAIKKQSVYVSATPGDYELEKVEGEVVEQVIRPTGLLDPTIEIRPTASQVADLFEIAQEVVQQQERVLVTTLTKKMAEDLTEYLSKKGLKVRYLHSDIDTLERVEILRDLRQGIFDVLVGINLLREGLDLPEVSLVAILDADKEGFLRSRRSLIQTFGRAARNVRGRVLLYADKITKSMQEAITETERRRKVQDAFNQENGITPQSVLKRAKEQVTDRIEGSSEREKSDFIPLDSEGNEIRDVKKLRKVIKDWEQEIRKLAKDLKFEEAAQIRDKVLRLRKWELHILDNKTPSLNQES